MSARSGQDQKSVYPVWVRFSSDVQPGNPDLGGTVGISIKLFGVAGEKILKPDEDALTQDFILQNHDVFFVDTARDMCEFTCQSLHGKSDEYLRSHPQTAEILQDMVKTITSVLDTPYWSVLPAQFGEQRFVKYKLEPIITSPSTVDINDPFYLRADLHKRLKQTETRFRFLLQFQADDMPLDQATVRWSEVLSPPLHVATLILSTQDIENRGQSAYGENLAFNTWHSLAEHAPTGSLAEARKIVYSASAANRRNVNGIPLGEPVTPRPIQYQPDIDYPQAKDRYIVRAAIHPAIGIARVGNSPDEFFIGPQVLELPRQPLGFYRDAQGALKRQAAEFRLYGYNAAGEVVTELTADRADIRWSAHVANLKASWFQLQMALDIPEADNLTLKRRNADIKDKAGRAALEIDGGLRSVAGKNAAGVVFTGHFTGVPVYLGELRTDAAGRLLFLGGRGVSASPTGKPIFTTDDSFINADGWYDDIADGPVMASVNIGGRDIPVESAWVVTAPPNYAPTLKAERTLYDLLNDLYLQAGWLTQPVTVSFRYDVYPILQRLTCLQWVNQGFATLFGYNGLYDFENPVFIKQLAFLPKNKEYDRFKELRRQILNHFRNPVKADGNPLPWPWLYGDAMEITGSASPRQNAAITSTQHAILNSWAIGRFISDWESVVDAPSSIEALPISEQPAMLDRAALEFCLADAFHPGCELTWPVRHLSLYYRPFRIRQRPSDVNPPDYGSSLNKQQALASNGPLYTQGPGDLSRWMGLPWQADTAECRSAYDTSYDPFLPTFWPARVPNQVLTERDYSLVIDTNQSRETRLAAFSNRTAWNKPLDNNGAGAEPMKRMVSIFGSMGLLEVREGIKDDADFPPLMLVASYGPDVTATDTESVLEFNAAKASENNLPLGANFTTTEAASQAPVPVRHPKS